IGVAGATPHLPECGLRPRRCRGVVAPEHLEGLSLGHRPLLCNLRAPRILRCEEENIHVGDKRSDAVTALGSAPVQSFLAAPEVAVLATLGADGAPHATPMWFLSEPDALYMLSVADTAKVRHLARDPRVSVAAETTRPGGGIGGVVLEGRAEMMGDS